MKYQLIIIQAVALLLFVACSVKKQKEQAGKVVNNTEKSGYVIKSGKYVIRSVSVTEKARDENLMPVILSNLPTCEVNEMNEFRIKGDSSHTFFSDSVFHYEFNGHQLRLTGKDTIIELDCRKPFQDGYEIMILNDYIESITITRVTNSK